MRMSVLCTWFVHDVGHKASQKTHTKKNPLSEQQDPLTFFLSSSFSFFVNFLIGVTAFPFLSAITAEETWEWSRVLQNSWQNIWHHNMYNRKWKPSLCVITHANAWHWMLVSSGHRVNKKQIAAIGPGSKLTIAVAKPENFHRAKIYRHQVPRETSSSLQYNDTVTRLSHNCTGSARVCST